VKLNAIPTSTRASTSLCELNVIDQVQNVARTTVVQDAWRRDTTSSFTAGSTDSKTG
jgi:carbonic anhydrase